jgi:hypothetical protein
VEIEKITAIQDKIEDTYKDLKEVKSFMEELQAAISYRAQGGTEDGSDVTSYEELKLEELYEKRSQLSQLLKALNEKKNSAKQKLLGLNEDTAMAKQRRVVISADPSISDFKNLSEADQERTIDELKQRITSLEYKSKQLNLLRDSQSNDIGEIERRPANPNREFLPELGEISRKLVSLESLFRSELPSSLSKIEDKRVASFTDFDRKYSKKIGRYYAQKMGSVFHADGVYTVQSVDIVDEVITTTTGKEINFDYLGTGHSQSSYLTTRLGMAGSKKVIALFDEVAMMDENSLSPVINRLKSKFQDGSLIGSIMVQRAESPSVEEL